MRALSVGLILGLSCVASIATAAPKQKAAVLGLEVIPPPGRKPDKETVRVAQDLTVALRLRPKAGTGPWTWAPGSERDLLDEKLIAACDNEAPACMAAIGAKLGADVLIYGKLENKGSDYQVSLRVLDVAAKKSLIGWTELLPAADATGTKLQDFAKRGYSRISGSPGPAPAAAPTTANTPAPPPAAKGSCDATEPTTKGDEHINTGTYAAALVQYEKALGCGPNPRLLIKAFIASCYAKNLNKAKFYWKKLPADKRDSYAQICIKQSIDPDAP